MALEGIVNMTQLKHQIFILQGRTGLHLKSFCGNIWFAKCNRHTHIIWLHSYCFKGNLLLYVKQEDVICDSNMLLTNLVARWPILMHSSVEHFSSTLKHHHFSTIISISWNSVPAEGRTSEPPQCLPSQNICNSLLTKVLIKFCIVGNWTYCIFTSHPRFFSSNQLEEGCRLLNSVGVSLQNC